MKRVIALSAFVVLGVASMTSCKKDYQCTCTSGGFTSTVDYDGLTKAEATSAETACTFASSCTWSAK